jgi:hypothetical protein
VGGIGSGFGGTLSQNLNEVKPPEVAQRILLFLLPDQIRDSIAGDLYELYTTVIVPSCGINKARLWYWHQVVCTMRLFFRLRKDPQNALTLWKGWIHMSKPTREAVPLHPGISMHHIQVGSGVAGLLFVFAIVFCFAVGIPAMRGLLVIIAILGILGSGLLFYWHKRHALKIQSLHLHQNEQNR